MKTFGLLGETLAHSFSPEIHAMLGKYPYALYEIPRESLDAFLRQTDLAGFNVTTPYKELVRPYCTSLSDIAQRIGSVNTMLRKPDGTYAGDNTDYAGFLRMLPQDTQRFAGKKALILGSGGASKTVHAVLKDLGMNPITVSRRGPVNYTNLSEHRDAALIVNATTVGMYPNNGVSLLDLSACKQCEFVADLIYNPAKTALLLQAERLGIPNSNGLLMLVEQARKAALLFTGVPIPETASLTICAAIVAQKKNVLLIGMPGCGKTTVGKCLADLTQRRFLDTDALIEQKAGKPIPEIFSTFGEAHFRALETEVLAAVCKESGRVISVGGGVVTVPANRDLIAQNSMVIFLERDVTQLSADGRPVTQEKGVEQLYRERLPLYRAWSDHSITNKTPQLAAQEIREVLHL